MISGWEIYFITLLDPVGAFFIILSFLSLIAFIVMMMIDYDSLNHGDKLVVNRRTKICASLALVFILIAVFLPTSASMAMIYIVPKIANSKFMNEVPNNIEKIINKQLESYIKND